MNDGDGLAGTWILAAVSEEGALSITISEISAAFSTITTTVVHEPLQTASASATTTMTHAFVGHEKALDGKGQILEEKM